MKWKTINCDSPQPIFFYHFSYLFFYLQKPWQTHLTPPNNDTSAKAKVWAGIKPNFLSKKKDIKPNFGNFNVKETLLSKKKSQRNPGRGMIWLVKHKSKRLN